MAFVLTPRIGLPTWGAPTDGPTRVEFNNGFLNLDNYVARDEQGNTAGRPTVGIRGRYYWDTDKTMLYRDNGAAYFPVGGNVETLTAVSPSTGTVTGSFTAPVGQTANVLEAHVGASLEASLSPGGDWAVNRALIGQRASLTNNDTSATVLYGRAAVSQAGDIVDIADNGGTNKYLNINASGTMKSYYLYNDSAASVIGRSQTSNANTATFSGQPILEVYSNKGGNAGAFQEFAYLRHAGVGSSTVARRLGMMMKIGEETTADQARTGGMYIESSAANANSPNLVLFRGDAPVMQFSSAQITAMLAMLLQGQLSIQTPTLQQAILYPSAGNAGYGYQSNNSIYERVGSSGGFYWYYGGIHSGFAGSAGAGGSVLAGLTNNGGTGALATGNLSLSSQTDPVNGADTSAVIIGSDGATGKSLHIGPSTIIAKTNGSGGPGQANLYLQKGGGDTYIGRSSFSDEGGNGAVWLPNSLMTKIGNRAFCIQYTQPNSPQTGDIWIAL